MAGTAGARAARDTGSTTVLATVVLALLSAGAMASISLVGAQQFAPASGQDHSRARDAGPRTALHAPAVVITPPAPVHVAEPAVHRPRKPRTPASADVTVVPAVLPATKPQHQDPPAPPERPDRAPAPPAAPLPSVVPATPAIVPTPTPPPPPPVTTPNPPPVPKPSVPAVPAYPPGVRNGTGKPGNISAYTPPRPASVGVLGAKAGRPQDHAECGQRGDHRNDGYDGGRSRSEDQRGSSGRSGDRQHGH